MKKIKSSLFRISCLMFFYLISPTSAFATSIISDPTPMAPPGKLGNLKTIINEVSGYLLWIAPSIAGVWIIVNGIRFKNANGDQQKQEKAWNGIKGSFIGGAIAFLGVAALNWFFQKIL